MCLSGKGAETRYSEGKVREHMGRYPATPLNTSLQLQSLVKPKGGNVANTISKPIYPSLRKSCHFTKVKVISPLGHADPKQHDTNSQSKNFFLNLAALDVQLIHPSQVQLLSGNFSLVRHQYLTYKIILLK